MLLTPVPIIDPFRAWNPPLCHKDTAKRQEITKGFGCLELFLYGIIQPIRAQYLDLSRPMRVLHSGPERGRLAGRGGQLGGDHGLPVGRVHSHGSRTGGAHQPGVNITLRPRVGHSWGSWLVWSASLALEVPVVEVIPPGTALDLLPGRSEGEQRAGGGGQEPAGTEAGEEGEKREGQQQQLHPVTH